jgi:hypothetical protein
MSETSLKVGDLIFVAVSVRRQCDAKRIYTHHYGGKITEILYGTGDTDYVRIPNLNRLIPIDRKSIRNADDVRSPLELVQISDTKTKARG